MKCDWQSYLKLIPQRFRNQVDVLGKEKLLELRLRTGRPPELVLLDTSSYLNCEVLQSDLDYCINAASQYSPWSATTISDGYITAQGGHRIGICGQMSVIDGKVRSVVNVTSLCIRVARDYAGLADGAKGLKGSILIVGSPGQGKTTLLRDLIRQKSDYGGSAVAVVDERRELFPVSCGKFSFYPGQHTDVLSGCSKKDGIEVLIRTMNPRYVAVDEITATEDSRAIIRARSCGVSILATAHAADMDELLDRPVYKPIMDAGVFKNILIMQPDKTWKQERVNI